MKIKIRNEIELLIKYNNLLNETIEYDREIIERNLSRLMFLQSIILKSIVSKTEGKQLHLVK